MILSLFYGIQFYIFFLFAILLGTFGTLLIKAYFMGFKTFTLLGTYLVLLGTFGTS